MGAPAVSNQATEFRAGEYLLSSEDQRRFSGWPSLWDEVMPSAAARWPDPL